MDYVINGFDDVAGLDELSFVERYAWFSFGSTSERGGSSALFFNKEDEKKTNKTKASLELGELTDLGDIYRSIGLPERTRWCQSERDCSRMPHRGRIFNVHFKPYGRKKSDRKKNA